VCIENSNLAFICRFTDNGGTVRLPINEIESTSVRVNLASLPANSASRTKSRRLQFPTIPLLGLIAAFKF
jgi:hypothetical protein